MSINFVLLVIGSIVIYIPWHLTSSSLQYANYGHQFQLYRWSKAEGLNYVMLGNGHENAPCRFHF